MGEFNAATEAANADVGLMAILQTSEWSLSMRDMYFSVNVPDIKQFLVSALYMALLMVLGWT